MNIISTNLEVSDWFAQLNENVDLWITDPPYPFENQNGTGRFSHIDGSDLMYKRLDWNDLGLIFSDMFSKTNKGGRAYVFCNRDGLFKTKELLENAGWKFRNILVWDKQAMGMGYHWRNQVEYICYVTKGSINKSLFVTGQPNIFYDKKPNGSDAIPNIGYYPTGTSPKPYKIWSKIMEHQLGNGEVVADPFAGSQPLAAAIQMNPALSAKVKSVYVNSYGI